MNYVSLGNTGLKVSQICLGCMSFGTLWGWTVPEEESRAIVRKALDHGINFFDTADIYCEGQSEEFLGRALKNFNVPRDRSVIATKVFFPSGEDPNARGLSRKHIRHSIDGSLKRLGTDYVDLYQIHRFDTETPVEEIMEALGDVVKAGKALHIGASTMAVYQLAKLLHRAEQRNLPQFVTMQNNYSLIYREEEREMIPFCRDRGIGLIPYSPLGGGLLAGNRRAGTARANWSQSRFNRFNRPADEAVIDAVAAVAAKRGVKPAQIAIAWLLAQPAVTAPIVGATKPSQLEEPIKALDTKLTAEEIAQLEEAYTTQPPIPAVVPLRSLAQNPRAA